MEGKADFLVEREGEITAIDAALERVAVGEGGTTLVEGPAGIGKSVLIREAVSRAADSGVRCITARGSELEIDFPFGVVRQLFEADLRADPESALTGAAAPAEAVFSAEAASPGGADDGSFSALHGLFWLTLNIAGDEPLLLVVDDLHWCDRPSLRFLAYLTHRLDGLAIGMLVAQRSNEPGADPGLIADIAGGSDVVVVRPRPLSRDAVGSLVGVRLGADADEPFRDAVGRVTGGNPLLLGQLLSALALEGAAPTSADVDLIADVGPRAVARTVNRRLLRLEPEAAEVARALAILGDGVDIETIAAYCELTPDVVSAAIASLARAEIVGTGRTIGFVHPLVRDALYEERVPGGRPLDHARAARLLRDRDASDERVAAQLIAAGPIGEDWAVETLERAAASASSRGALESATTYLSRVLDEELDDEHRARLRFGLGIAQFTTDGPGAVIHLMAARDGLVDPVSRAIAGYALTRGLLFTDEPARAAAIASEEAARLRDGELADFGRMIESTELMCPYFGAEVDEHESRMAAYRRPPADSLPGSAMVTALAAFDWMMRDGEADECAALAESALECEALMEYDNGLLWTGANLVLVAAERPRAMEVWDEALRASHRRGSTFGALTVHLWRGYTLLRHGDLDDAAESLGLAVEMAELWGTGATAYALGFRAITLLELGRTDEAAAMLASLESPSGFGEAAQICRLAEIELLLQQGRAEVAVERAVEYAKINAWRTGPAFIDRNAALGRALSAAGRAQEAVAELQLTVERAENWGAPGTLGRALTLLGTAKGDDGLTDLERAIELLEGSTMRLDHAKALSTYGSLRRRLGKRSASREPLREAFELAESCGAEPLVATIRTELHASGLRPRNSALSGPGSLTASERRVADLAASGRTNKEIAQELFVTPKTVEVHLSNTYRKLDISGRRELAGALDEGQ